MDDGPSAKTITVRQTLDLLDGRFSEFAAGVAQDHYVFWLGSGISFGRVPGLWDIVPKVIEYLRSRVDNGDSNCRYKRALEQALDLASLNDEESSRVDFAAPFEDWPDAKSITKRLITNYARLLDVEIDGEPEDQLLWEGVDVVGVYANPDINPDAEHLCIAILVKEGVLSDVASANWDGLIERAASDLTAGDNPIVVCVRSEDLQLPPKKAYLLKFHGCAVKAGENEDMYRAYLIGRASQINGWRDRDENAGMVGRLRDLISTKPTLMLGLSAQDANIQSVFSLAEAVLSWDWPNDRPSYVFSQEEIGPDQKGLLKIVYRDHYREDTRAAIHESAHLRAYAKQLLIALVLHVLTAKLGCLLTICFAGADNTIPNSLRSGLTGLRNILAEADTGDYLGFVQTLIEHTARIRSLFQSGDLLNDPPIYHALTIGPVQQVEGDATLVASGLPEAAVLSGIIGHGVANGFWTLRLASTTDPKSGFGSISTSNSTTPFFVVANQNAAQKLFLNRHVEEGDDAILIHSQEMITRQSRSPQRAPGRTGRLQLREVSIKELLESVNTPEELTQRFREEASL